MARVSYFIDGFNFYHSLNNPVNPVTKKPKYKKYLWLDYYKFLKKFLRKNDTIADIYYFSAFAHWRPNSVKLHQLLISAWQNTSIKPIIGEFKEKDRFCTKCQTYVKQHEEKQTDVNIGICLIRDAFQDRFDTALIVTNDTDLVPAIKMLKDTFPTKKHLSKSQFPNTILLPTGKSFTRPPTWV